MMVPEIDVNEGMDKPLNKSPNLGDFLHQHPML